MLRKRYNGKVGKKIKRETKIWRWSESSGGKAMEIWGKAKISNVLLKEKLASCINIIPGVLSMYHWKGEINKDNEVLMMIKTKKNLFSQIVSCVKLNHPYEVPEVIAVPIQYGSKDYLDWVSNSVKSDEDEQTK
ncbi:cutA homologue, putative [Plasmodium ovale wallikeri]|uniref:CutA homologue, putative n=1 Tax=Plasmodium ovale wallikeri TaxID=864142 RepID=A0A1A9A486_PLAOA|nr:cutA homologue, putative [Plasmodium ovale wallikeri]SBT50910.1 cutA homologue, putative [Plasmodium ovale wallikeri]